ITVASYATKYQKIPDLVPVHELLPLPVVITQDDTNKRKYFIENKWYGILDPNCVIAMNGAVFIFFIEYAAVNYNLEFFGGNTLLSSDAQIIGIIILEIGICFHSVIIGMALSVSTGSNFISLWVALVFHQIFEGLGLGSRIAELNYPENSIKPWLMSCAYGLTTPIGIGMGLGVHESYNPASQTALIVQGTLNSLLAEFYIFCFG
ncbi:171_t:CDS:2, partial [Gigaspora margarita]